MITVVRADITTLRVDAIVNAANEALRGGGGVDGAIHLAAGPRLLQELLRYPSCPTGGAVATMGYDLPSRYVIHAVGPVWRGGKAGERMLLEKAYVSAFQRALELGDVGTVAFPAISTGVYGFPKADAADIAVDVMQRHETQFAEITACLFDDVAVKLYHDALKRADARARSE